MERVLHPPGLQQARFSPTHGLWLHVTSPHEKVIKRLKERVCRHASSSARLYFSGVGFTQSSVSVCTTREMRRRFTGSGAGVVPEPGAGYRTQQTCQSHRRDSNPSGPVQSDGQTAVQPVGSNQVREGSPRSTPHPDRDRTIINNLSNQSSQVITDASSLFSNRPQISRSALLTF